jgi:hypothetical protein
MTEPVPEPVPEHPTVKPKRPFWKKWWVWVLGVLAFMIVLGAIVGEEEKGSGPASKVAPSTSQGSSPPATPAEAAPPSAAQVKEAFESFIDERAKSGARLAQSVTSVTVTGGVVTVALNPPPVVLQLSPFDNLAELFGKPVAYNDDEGVWLRKIVQRVDVVDAHGKSLGSMTAAQLNKMGTG